MILITSDIGTKRTSIDVRFFAAVGAIADTARPDRAEPIYEYTSRSSALKPESPPLTDDHNGAVIVVFEMPDDIAERTKNR